jgi:intracellular septation protein A
MRIWTYIRPFSYRGEDYVVELAAHLTRNVSRLWRGDELLDEQSVQHMDGIQTTVHALPADAGEDTRVEVGFVNWWSVGIVVLQGEDTLYETHPGKNVRVLEGLLQGTAMSSMTSQADSCHEPETGPDRAAGSHLSVAQMVESNRSKWERNKYSIYADMALGALFFLVGKFTEDLALAAIIGAAAGLALVVVQRFVKVDLLGGFAVFGTIMLLISAGFSLALQDDYWVQMKSTVLGIFTASLFMIDGVVRQGAYFGARIERYMPMPLHHGRIATGISLTGLVMAYGNYLVAENFSEDFWLTYTTFLDIPVSMAMFYAVVYWARKKPTDTES